MRHIIDVRIVIIIKLHRPQAVLLGAPLTTSIGSDLDPLQVTH